jgi:hypothetical protein
MSVLCQKIARSSFPEHGNTGNANGLRKAKRWRHHDQIDRVSKINRSRALRFICDSTEHAKSLRNSISKAFSNVETRVKGSTVYARISLGDHAVRRH